MSDPANNSANNSDDADAETLDAPACEEAAEAGLLDELLAERSAGPREQLAASPREPLGVRIRVGKLVEWTSGQAPKVEFEGNERGPLPARSVVPLNPTIIAEAIRSERGVLLSFEDGRPDAPIITGLVQDWEAAGDPEQQEVGITEAEARIDGRRIEFEAADEIVLRCGQASITLRRNGRVVIRGTYVESRSRGVNRIKGGSVEIN